MDTHKNDIKDDNKHIIRLQPHTVILVIGVDCKERQARANEIYSSLQVQTAYVKHICLDDEAAWLADGDSIAELTRAARDSVTTVLSRLRSVIASSMPALAVIVSGEFTSCNDIQRILGICESSNYYQQLVTVENIDKTTEMSLHDEWNTECCAQITLDWSDSKYLIATKDSLLVTLELSSWNKCQLPPKNWWIVGDIHGCFFEFIKLLEEHIGWSIENGLLNMNDGDGLILTGDLIDRGTGSREVIEFLHLNITAGREIRIVTGNHEIANLNCIDDKTISYDSVHFTTISELREDAAFEAIFRSLMNYATPFVQYTSGSNATTSFIVTHSVCPRKYRARIDPESINQQSYLDDPILTSTAIATNSNVDPILERLRIGGYIRSLNTKLSILTAEPIHYSGHLTISDVYYVVGDPVILLDTGCVFGGSLSAICHSDKKIVQVLSHNFNKDIPIKNEEQIAVNITTMAHLSSESLYKLMMEMDEISLTESDGENSHIPHLDLQDSEITELPIITIPGYILPILPLAVYHTCPPNAGVIECPLTALQQLAINGVGSVFAFTIPNGENVRFDVHFGSLPDSTPLHLRSLHTSLQPMMLTYGITVLHVDAIKELPAVFPNYRAAILHIERLLHSGAETALINNNNHNNNISELSLGKTLELYRRAEAISSKYLVKNGKYHLVDICYAKFTDGSEWKYGKVNMNWGNPQWRRKILHREGRNGTILSSAIFNITTESGIDAAYERIINMVANAREGAFAIILQPASELGNVSFRIHTPRGMLLKYGPLYMCNSEYTRAARKHNL